LNTTFKIWTLDLDSKHLFATPFKSFRTPAAKNAIQNIEFMNTWCTPAKYDQIFIYILHHITVVNHNVSHLCHQYSWPVTFFISFKNFSVLHTIIWLSCSTDTPVNYVNWYSYTNKCLAFLTISVVWSVIVVNDHNTILPSHWHLWIFQLFLGYSYFISLNFKLHLPESHDILILLEIGKFIHSQPINGIYHPVSSTTGCKCYCYLYQ
jgi:hypothetical protein